MEKRFNTTGLCIPEKHYMVDISDKIEEIKVMIEEDSYFVINRPRQYGKTTTLNEIFKALKNDYLVIAISFEGIGDIPFSSEELFCSTFIDLVIERLEYIDENIGSKLVELSKNIKGLRELSKVITKFTRYIDKEIILIIDEVDKSSDNQLFLSFLGMLRNKYLLRETGMDFTFKSVILAGVYDIKNLKLRLRTSEEQKYNSPWNIAIPFNVDMSLSEKGIEKMLNEYSLDNNIKIDATWMAQQIVYFTDGYPFLVSRLCQIIDIDLKKEWNNQNIISAVKSLLEEKNTLFDDLIKNIENNKKLSDYIFDILLKGEKKEYNIDSSLVDLGVTFGYFKNENGTVQISNKVLEQRIINYFTANLNATNITLYNIKDNYIDGTGLNFNKILLKFQQFMKEQYSTIDEKFIEREARLLFLAFIKPIINGVGFDFKEAQIAEEKRLDIVVTYNTHKYIIELKIWRGEEYYKKGLEQLSEYLDITGVEKGYLVVFGFNKNKEYKSNTIEIGSKEIFEVFV